MKVLIVGGNGFIGRSLTAELRHQGVETAIWSSQGENPEIGADGRLTAAAKIPAGVVSIVFLAQSPHFRAPSNNTEHLFQVNSKLPVEIARMATEQGISHFCQFSTGAVYAPTLGPMNETGKLNQETPYARSKILGEEALRELRERIHLLIVRPFFAYGPGQSGMLIPQLTEKIKNGIPIDLHPLEGEKESDGLKLTPIFVGDLSRIVADMLSRRLEGTINLAGDQQLSLRDIGEQIGQRLKKEPKFALSPQARETNFIADIEKLRAIAKPRFTTFSEAIDA